jgi:hypothetical protein
MCDLLHFAQKVPSVPVERRMALAEVAAARAYAVPRPSWCAIFTKAYAHVAKSRPQLRRAFISFPKAHFYEHPLNVASIAIERQFGAEDAVFFMHLRAPEDKSLAEIDAQLRRFKTAPLETLGSVRQALLLSRLPAFIRRFAWWFGLNVWGRKRAHYFGTFAVTVYAGLGAASLHPLSPLTSTLNYGIIGPDGAVDVRLIYDHRVIDGAAVARALTDLEAVLQREIRSELLALRPRQVG